MAVLKCRTCGRVPTEEAATTILLSYRRGNNGFDFTVKEGVVDVLFVVEDGDDPTTPATTAPTTPTTTPVTDPTTPKPTKTITVGVIKYVYNETSTDLDSYMLRYWGDGDVKTADAVCTPLNTTEEVSVGKNYWNNEAKTFYMFTAEIPAEATGYKFHIGDDRWFGEDGDPTKYNAVYAFNYSGDKALYDTVTVIDPTVPVTDPTTEPTTEPPTTEPPTTEPPTTEPPTTEPPTQPKTTKTITVGVIEYVYNETKSNVGSYQVHYWGGAKSGDATCTALNTTEMKSVGSSYWSGEQKNFYMFTVEIPEDATGFKFHIGDRWFGDDGDTSKYNTVYIFNPVSCTVLYTDSYISQLICR